VAEQRKKFWIDNIQTRMTIRVMGYCLMYQIAIWVIWQVVQTYRYTLSGFAGESPPQLGLFALVATIAFMAILTYDAILYVHRIVGPIYRFRKTVQAIAAGEPVSLVHLRKGDFLLDFRDDLNRMIETLEEKGLVVLREDNKQAPQEAVAR
jgi:methyl-accepting chemotaxis protein